jgi:hypothetical protein
MISIDSMNLSRLDVIKVDVEGAEPIVFHGARQTIKKHLPIIIFEKNFQSVTSDMKNSMNLEKEVYDFDIVKFASKLGYNRMIYIPRDNYVLMHPSHSRIMADKKVNFTPVKKFKEYTFPRTYDLYEMKKPKW